jgi:hypothetical protein
MGVTHMFTLIETKLRVTIFLPSQNAQALFCSHRQYIPAFRIELDDQLPVQFSAFYNNKNMTD